VEFVVTLGNQDITGLLTADISGMRTSVSGGVAEIQAAVPGNNEVQTILLAPVAKGGDFTLDFEGETTLAIPYNATAAGVQQALEKLATIDVGEISVTGIPGAWSVEFVGPMSRLNIASVIGGDPSNLAGGFPAPRPDGDFTFSAFPSLNEKQTITLDPIVTSGGGTFTLRLTGPDKTDPLNHDASTAAVESALESLEAIGSGNVHVTGTPGAWVVEFIGELSATDVADIQVNTSELRRGEPIQVEVDTEASLANEVHVVSLPSQVNGGTFTLSFQSIQVEETIPGDDSTSEKQTITLPAGVTGGTFTLNFDGEETDDIPFDAGVTEVQEALQQISTIAGAGNVLVDGVAGGPWTVTFQGTLEMTDVPLIRGDAADLTGPFTATLDHNATPNEVQTALQSLVSLGGPAATSVEVTGQSMQIEEKIPGRDGIKEVQTLVVPEDASGGGFTLTFEGEQTAAIPFDADPIDPDQNRFQIEKALNDLVGLEGVSVTEVDSGSWEVEFGGSRAGEDVPLLEADTGDLRIPGGPWTIEFVGDFGGMPLELITGNGDNLSTSGFGDPTVDTTTHGGDGGNVLVSTKQFNHCISVEQLRIEGDTGDDRVILRGVPATFEQGVFFDGGDGTDVIEMVWDDPDADLEASFVAPVFTGDDQGTLTFGSRDVTIGAEEGTAVQFASVEGEIIFDAGTIAGVETQEGSPVFKETQTITVPPGTTDFTLTVDMNPGGAPRPATTYPIPYDADADFVRDALNSLDQTLLLPATFSVTKPEQGKWRITFEGRFAFAEHPAITTSVGKTGHASLSGTDDGDDIRFAAGPAGGGASFARSAQVRITLRNFNHGSSVELLGQQGDDTISVALNGVTEFGQITAVGGGPVGTDALRIEGSGLDDSFAFSPGVFHHLTDTPGSKDGTVAVGDTMPSHLDLQGFAEYSFVGAGGNDRLTVTSPSPDSNDTIRLFPEVGNNASFLFMSQPAGPETNLVYSPVSFESIQTRNFDSRAGTDTLYISTDQVPGVSTGLAIDGGSGVAAVTLGDQTTMFTHDTLDEDILIFDITATRDGHDIAVTPGIGLDISLSVGAGYDILTFNAKDTDLVVRLDETAISQPGYGDVTFVGTEDVNLLGGGTANTFMFDGPASRERFVYTPLSPNSGGLIHDGGWAGYAISDFFGRLVINGGPDVGDEVIVMGSRDGDVFRVDGPARTVTVVNQAGTLLLPVELGADMERVGVDGDEGDDLFLVTPAPGGALPVGVDGGAPNASDRLVVEDAGLGDVVRHHQGPDGRSGSVIVGAASPIAYNATERVDILPLDPVTGGTGTDGLGRIVVFHADRLEQNDSRLNPTEMPDLAESIVKPNIDPGGIADPFGSEYGLPGDEDWYRYYAPKTGTFRFEVAFDPVGTLENNNPGLPGDGLLRIDVYDPDGAPIPKIPGEGHATHTVGVEVGKAYFLRVRGVAPEAINVYDVGVVDLDELGPQVTDVFITSEPAFNLFDPKPTKGPTPLADSLTVALWDLPARFPGFLYEALDEGIASVHGHYRVVGDHNGVIPIAEVEVINAPPVVGYPATATILLHFEKPLADDRYTLTVSDALIDPGGNHLDGESNAVEPHNRPDFPSGDGVSGGDFVARFTVDSRPEIGTWSAGSVYVDTNGNFLFDPQNGDFTHRDLAYALGFATDHIFAGNFAGPGPDGYFNTYDDPAADGFDKLAAYGVNEGGSFRWLVDTDNDGVPNIDQIDAPTIGYPVAGDFARLEPDCGEFCVNHDAHPSNGDEVGLFTGTAWWLDQNRNFQVGDETPIETPYMNGYPIVGDFDGDGLDDLGTYDEGVFQFDLAFDGFGGGLNGEIHLSFVEFIGVREWPVAADMDMDGIDDVGLWVPDRSGVMPEKGGEWYFLLSDDRHAEKRIVGQVNTLDHEFSPIPLGNDLFAQFGDEFAEPVVGNFDPPVAGEGQSSGRARLGLAGTPDDDVLEFRVGSSEGTWTLTLNGKPIEEVSGEGVSIEFDGLGGNDTVVVVGDHRDDLARLWPQRGVLSGDDYLVMAANVEWITAVGGGGDDVAKLYGSPEQETFKATPQSAALYNDQFRNNVVGFRYVHAVGAGENDVAKLYDDPATPDTFRATPEEAALYGGAFYNRVVDFRYVHAVGSSANDTAKLYDDPATQDTFRATPDDAALYGDAFYNRVVGFRYVHGVASNASDVAKLYDDPATPDTFKATPQDAVIYNGEFYNRAYGFRYVHGVGSSANDVAKLYDDPATQDTFRATPQDAALYNGQFYNRAYGFRYVHGVASNEDDVA
ncbi:MAG: hypothetical protein ACYTG0_31755, partial [Planctomycetota bacterium]